jgi:formylglycine-generating enzyme
MSIPLFRLCALATTAFLIVACNNKGAGSGGSGGQIGATGGRAGTSGTGTLAGGQGGSAGSAGIGGSAPGGAGGGTATYSCGGTPLTCGLHLSETDCVVVGCDWASDKCTGTPRSCPTSGGSATCTGVLGCSWSSYDSLCTGSPYACSLMLDSSECSTQGCSWQPAGCSGQPFACAHFTTEFSCTTLAGCTWQIGSGSSGSGGGVASGGIGAGGAGGRDVGTAEPAVEPTPEPGPDARPDLPILPDVSRPDRPDPPEAIIRDAAVDFSTTSITVAKEGNGDGTITSSPSGINCGSTCSANFITGSSLTLTARPNGTSTFAGWSSGCGSSGTCTLSADAAKTVTAHFDAVMVTLSVSRAGAGWGTITSTPAGIDCGTTCSASFPDLTSVTLTAVADPDSVFRAWQGPCTGTTTCSVTVRDISSVTAIFAKAQGSICSTNSECVSGTTGVCCAQSTCPACQNCGSDGQCSVVVANAEDITGTTCSGNNICDAAHACKAKDGGACTVPADCASGSCTDAHCCAQTCGVCQACTGADGTCAAITVGDDADSCTGNNTCDLNGTCKKKDGQSCTAAGDCASGGCIASVCAEPVAAGPSCASLSKTCGPTGNQSCCATLAVPGGSFYRYYDGINLTDKSFPATVAGFYLDKYVATIGRFRAFVNGGMGVRATAPAAGAGAHPLIAGSGWSADWTTNLPTSLDALNAALKCSASSDELWTDAAAGKEEMPMNCLSWYLAFAFCAWDGGRLPTQAEAMYAAAGGDEQRVYPWGSAALDDTRAAYGCRADGLTSCTLADIIPVGSKPAGNGRWNHMDLSGNVWGWLLDWRLDPAHTFIVPCDNCANLAPATYREIHGGGYGSQPAELLAGYSSSNTPSKYFTDIGVRCARDHL